MKDQQGADRRDSVAWAAGIALARLQQDIGVPGLAAMRALPELLARVDQHAAEVRDTLVDDDGDITVTALAGYADGVLDIAAARGVDPFGAARAGYWAGPPWALLRLLAVCQLAESRRSPD